MFNEFYCGSVKLWGNVFRNFDMWNVRVELLEDEVQ